MDASGASAQFSYVPGYMATNSQQYANIRVFAALVAGVVSGVLGLTNILGFLAYVAAMALTSAGVYLALRGNVRAHFISWKAFLVDGAFDGMMTYILFWTLMYNVVHLF